MFPIQNFKFLPVQKSCWTLFGRWNNFRTHNAPPLYVITFNHSNFHRSFGFKGIHIELGWYFCTDSCNLLIITDQLLLIDHPHLHHNYALPPLADCQFHPLSKSKISNIKCSTVLTAMCLKYSFKLTLCLRPVGF